MLLTIRSVVAVSLVILSFRVGLTQEPTSPKQVTLAVSVAKPVLRADKKQKTFVKVALTGFELPSSEARPPVNVALVIDKSGSMRGEKIEKAKLAAIAAIDRLRSTDIVSVVVYHDGVQVVLPATKLTDKEQARAAIRTIRSGGSTALFAGVGKGAAEVRKFLDEERVNRVILLSDGRANVGPDSASELGDLGASLLKENIAVTTLGLGLDYNEDLMTKLALRSNGSHLFVDNADDLVATFQHEFNDVLSVVAQEISININVREGIRPVDVLGYEADIHGQEIAIQLNQLYARQERFVLLELEVPATASGASRDIASMEVRYANMLTKAVDSLVGTASIRFSDDPQECKQQDRDVAEKAALLVANKRNLQATLLRDQGKVDEARKLLVANSFFLREKAQQLNSRLLEQQTLLNRLQSDSLEGFDWQRTRKLMLRDNAAVEQQSSGYGGYGGGGYGGGYGGNGGYGGYGSSKDTQLITTPNEPVNPSPKKGSSKQ